LRTFWLSVALTLICGANAVAQMNSPKEVAHMTLSEASPAVTVARAHVEAWSHHDWDKAKASLARDVHVIALTTQPVMAPTDLTGAENYMEGLKKFAGAVVPGSARVTASIGDDRNALLFVTVKAAFGPGGAIVTLPAARLYLLDESGKIKVEQVVFFVAPQ